MSPVLVSCLLCKGKVASNATHCPNCGTKDFMPIEERMSIYQKKAEAAYQEGLRKLDEFKEFLQYGTQRCEVCITDGNGLGIDFREYGIRKSIDISIDGICPKFTEYVNGSGDETSCYTIDIKPGHHNMTIVIPSRYKKEGFCDVIYGKPVSFSESFFVPHGQAIDYIMIYTKWEDNFSIFNSKKKTVESVSVKVIPFDPNIETAKQWEGKDIYVSAFR